MTENEKRLKIVQKKSYEEDLAESSGKVTSNIFGLGVSAVGMASLFTVTGLMINADPESVAALLPFLGGFMNLGFNVKAINGLIKATIKQAIAEDRINTINAELSLNAEEEKGKSR